MSKKKFKTQKNVQYYTAQKVITEQNKISKADKHNKNNPNDIIKAKNPQLSKEIIDWRKLEKLSIEQNKTEQQRKLNKAVAVSENV